MWTRSLGVLVEFFVKQDDSKSRGSMLNFQKARCEARLNALHAEATAAEAELADAMVCGLTARHRASKGGCATRVLSEG